MKICVTSFMNDPQPNELEFMVFGNNVWEFDQKMNIVGEWIKRQSHKRDNFFIKVKKIHSFNSFLFPVLLRCKNYRKETED